MQTNIQASRYHDISCGHRVVGHEGKCALLHGHNYRVHFRCVAPTTGVDKVGRIIDFGVIKSTLCAWLENEWDHKFLAWRDDKLMDNIRFILAEHACVEEQQGFTKSIVWVPFNPTAENMAHYLLTVIGPRLLPAHVRLTEVIIEETRKCSAGASL